MRILDLYCCGGGASAGYVRAGHEVTGVDIEPQPEYPYAFVQSDAITYAWYHGRHFDFVHASPPCHAHSALNAVNRRAYVDWIPNTRQALDVLGIPYVIENVQGSTVRRDLTLCGEMFGLGVIRHRYFEFGNGASCPQPQHIPHRGRVRGWRHGVMHDGPYVAVHGDGGSRGTVAECQVAMEINWINRKATLAQAIPPAYTEYIAKNTAINRIGYFND